MKVLRACGPIRCRLDAIEGMALGAFLVSRAGGRLDEQRNETVLRQNRIGGASAALWVPEILAAEFRNVARPVSSRRQ